MNQVQDLKSVPNQLFNSFCSNPNRARDIVIGGRPFTVYAFPGSMGAIGKSGDKGSKDPMIVVWETMPLEKGGDVPVVFEMKIGVPKGGEFESLLVKKGNSSLGFDCAPFSRILREAEELCEGNIII